MWESRSPPSFKNEELRTKVLGSFFVSISQGIMSDLLLSVCSKIRLNWCYQFYIFIVSSRLYDKCIETCYKFEAFLISLQYEYI